VRIFGKTGLFGADRWGLGRARAVRSVRGAAAKRAKTGGEQCDIFSNRRHLCHIAYFQGFSGVFGRLALKKQSDRKQIYN
jgi:hypothetical protein